VYRVQNALAGMNPIEVEKSVLKQYDLNYRFFIKKEKLETWPKNLSPDASGFS